MISVVLDVNVLVAAVISQFGLAHRLLLAWQAKQFSVVTSEHIITEVGEKLRLDRINRRYGITPDEVEALQSLLRRHATVVPLPALLPVVTGDPEDDAVLATARLGQAGYLVTSDTGLLALRSYEGTRVLSAGAFRDLLP
jgi:putative PIN family toxin of toxin-antitoxin system